MRVFPYKLNFPMFYVLNSTSKPNRICNAKHEFFSSLPAQVIVLKNNKFNYRMCKFVIRICFN